MTVAVGAIHESSATRGTAEPDGEITDHGGARTRQRHDPPWVTDSPAECMNYLSFSLMYSGSAMWVPTSRTGSPTNRHVTRCGCSESASAR